MSIWSLRLTLFCLLAILAGGRVTVAADTPGSVIEEQAENLGARGASWVVTRHGQVTEQRQTGKTGDGSPFEVDTPIVLGSVAKPILATIATSLAEEGSLGLDQPVVNALPDFAGDDPRRLTITPRQLLGHTSGLPFGADYLDVDDPNRTAAHVVAESATDDLVHDPGSEYLYSSLGYVVLTALIEQITQQPLSELIPTEYPGTSLTTELEGLPGGYRSLLAPLSQRSPRDGAGGGYGYLGGSAVDLSRVGIDALAHPGRTSRMIDGADPAPDQTGTGLGWRVNKEDGHDIIWHTGTAPGYFSALYLDPGSDLTVAVTVNASGVLDEQRLYSFTRSVFDHARGMSVTSPPRSWLRWAIIAVLPAVSLLSSFLVSGSSTGRRWWGLALVSATLAAPLVYTFAVGYPPRYLILWAPEIVYYLCVMLVIVGISLTAGTNRPKWGRPRP